MKDAIIFHYVYLINICFWVHDLKLILVNVNGLMVIRIWFQTLPVLCSIGIKSRLGRLYESYRYTIVSVDCAPICCICMSNRIVGRWWLFLLNWTKKIGINIIMMMKKSKIFIYNICTCKTLYSTSKLKPWSPFPGFSGAAHSIFVG